MAIRRALVTGGSGFIASHLVKTLLQSGCEVGITTRCIDRERCFRLKDVWDQLAKFEVDVRNVSALKPVFEFNPDTIFHLAAYNHVDRSFDQHEECYDINLKGTANLLQLCNWNTRFVYVSSSEVFGFAGSNELPWDDFVDPVPMNPYALSKRAAELHCEMYLHESQAHIIKNLVIVRPFSTYGPGQSCSAVIPLFIRLALSGKDLMLSNGQQTRNFNYVTDIVSALIKAADSNLVGGPFNVGDCRETSILDLAVIIKKLCNSDSLIRVGALPDRRNETRRASCYSRRFQDKFGWKPEVSLEDGLKLTIDSIRREMGLV